MAPAIFLDRSMNQINLQEVNKMWQYKNTLSPDELYHHGILKQKWGKRNGPPYPLSSSQKSSAEKKAESKSSTSSESGKDSGDSSSKSVKEMSNDELRDAINRLQMEKQYKLLITEASEKKKVSKGKQIATDILESAVKDIGKQAASYGLGTAVNSLSKAAGGPDDIVNPKKAQKAK